MIELARYEIMVAELYRRKEIVGTDNDKKKKLFVPPKFFYHPLPKYNGPSLIRDLHNFEHNAIVGQSSIKRLLIITK